ncbi:methyltransferase [Streptomonospora nanhaiensis]|uniref:SAM-dependent methyltransferase n=1 Tax=Streptomonospora nanhaiensis TaxID=1323731 RepID=A0A853BHA9_9ACTN|nr:methyltransferase [Streptomonospora nanhaiensis]MBV2362481.1 methyltransferase domain-containing protein [Streptomonospora nanhaiensis]MBX9389057.1 methyltransferase domain-containing protein [Streptomonospora nanhaiensis]NYI94858.1 SAM-dependent methyltransferase [Streptomonospora nanhaiensis]
MSDTSDPATPPRPAPGGTGVPHRAATAARTEVVWDVLRGALARLAPDGGQNADGAGTALDIVDAGGGTGGAAVPLAALGHRVTVVDPSPDSLAALERRAAEAGVRVRALQGETGDLAGLLPPEHAHLVLVHNVLEYVEDPAVALAEVAALTRPGGAVSVLATNAVAGVLHRALGGHLAEARRLLGDPEGRWGANDPMPRRFTADQLVALAEHAGLADTAIRGVRVFADLLPGRVIDGDTQIGADLVELERAAAEHPALSGIATQIHLLARRPA